MKIFHINSLKIKNRKNFSHIRLLKSACQEKISFFYGSANIFTERIEGEDKILKIILLDLSGQQSDIMNRQIVECQRSDI